MASVRRRCWAGHPRLFTLAKSSPRGAPLAISEQLVACGFPAPEAEYRFAAAIGRKWAFDFAWPASKIALEIEGGAFGRYIVVTNGYERRRGQTIPLPPGTVIRAGGRHNTGSGLQADASKYNHAAAQGWCVIRATTTKVRDGDALRDLAEAFRARAGLAIEVPQ